jgi:putative Mn2+ efflux pump MntP
MELLSLVLIALSLSMDAFAVSISSGISIRNLRFFHALRASFFFGLFQFLMPLAGWYMGGAFSAYISAYDHWIAFALLGAIGGKMLAEGWKTKSGGGEKPADIRNLRVLLTLAVATSIDALAIGVSFNLLDRPIWGSSAFIGGVTFFVCFVGFEFGRRLGRFFEKYAQIAGGLILMGLGVKILLEHLF